MTKAYPITDEILIDHVAVLAKTGKGKTYMAKGIVERLLKKKRRVCIVDPKNAWWGLKSSADGKSPGFPIIIFGGPNADVPLLSSHGKVLGEAVATTNMACIICTKGMPEGERIRFLTDFFQTLDMKNTDPLHLVLDEAHMMAPQKPLGEMQRLTHWTSELVSGGRGSGFRILLLSQRPARLNKDVLTQCETLVAMGMTGPQDRDAVWSWIEDQADRETGKQIIASLPSLQKGEGWIWSPVINMLERVKFPAITTYDNSKTKKDGQADARAELAPVDLKALEAKLGAVKADIDAKDPAKLKARIAELEKALVAKKPTAVVTGGKAVTEAERVHERSVGYNAGYAAAKKEDAKALTAMNKTWSQWQNRALELVGKFARKQQEAADVGVNLTTWLSTPPQMQEVANAIPAPPAPAPRRSQPNSTQPIRIDTAELGKAVADTYEAAMLDHAKPTGNVSQRILDAIAWWEQSGVPEPTRTQVAFMAGFTSGKVGHFKTAIGAQVSSGLVLAPTPGRVTLSDAGRDKAKFPTEAPSVPEVQRRAMERLDGPSRRILTVVLRHYPDDVTRESIALQANFTSHNVGHFKTSIGKAVSRDLLLVTGPGKVKAAPWLFMEKAQ